MNKITHSLFTILVLLSVSSCSLLKIQLAGDSTPLPKNDLNLRVSTQQFISSAFSSISLAVDSIKKTETDKQVISRTLFWGISVESGLQKSALQQMPRYALVDTWLFVKQMNDFLEGPKGESNFKAQLPLIQSVGTKMQKQIEAIARAAMRHEEYEEMKHFVLRKSKEEPFDDLRFARNSVYKEWLTSIRVADSIAITTVGTLPEVMSDFTNRMAILKEGVETEAKWQYELFSLHTGITPELVKASTDSIQKLIGELVVFAQQSPEMIDTSLVHLNEIMTPIIDQMDRRVSITMAQIALERQAISDLISSERAEVMASVDSISVNLTREVMTQMRGIIATTLGWLTLLLAVIIFLPFIIGFFVGRIFTRNKHMKKKQAKEED